MDLQQSLWLIFPEIIIIITIIVVVLAELILPPQKRHQTGWFAATGLVAAFFVTLNLFKVDTAAEFFGRMVVHDAWSLFFKLFFEISGFLIVIFSLGSKETRGKNQGEYYALLLAVIMGLIFMTSATDLVMILLAMETVGILSYVLVGFNKASSRSGEAALKYLIYGATATGVMLFGMSYLYGLTGTTNLFDIADSIAQSETGFTLTVIMLFILVGFGFKIAMAPFHMWCPDVYEGAPTPITAFLSVGPKAAGFALLLRFFFSTLTQPALDGAFTVVGTFKWPLLIAILSAFTMTVGNLSAITQSNVKRLLAYSSIAHAGYMLMGVVVLHTAGLRAILFYLIVYLFMNIGAFMVVAAIRDGIGSEEIDDYKGIGRRMPFAPIMLALFLFALTGLPPLSGFIGKFYLFFAVIDAGIYWLVTVAIINTVISLYYYARIVKAMFFDEGSQTTPVPVTPLQIIVVSISAIPTLILGIYWAPIIDFAEQSIQMLM
ncbi:NADH-quinone oxidoreductase subunit N [candidate division CSSED10-310 bacterium]|uniref:NADH-quinone oxidoreductase subunit N n=1 Tax=candidate division CSSED10-310 bacterium TaxID=2855610 RepID=A0ABV6Z355_UNCC1